MPDSLHTQTHNIPYGIPLTKGQNAKLSGVHKFGFNSAVGTAYESIWEGGGVYPWQTSADQLVATSASGSSDAGKKITIQGVDAAYNSLSEELTLDANGTATTTAEYYRVNRAFNSGPDATVGAIDIDDDGTSTLRARIEVDYQQTQMAVYTIPAEHEGFIVQLSAGIQKNQEIVLKLNTREPSKVWRTKSLISTFAEHIDRKFDFPFHLTPGTDIDIQCKAGATTAISADMEIVLDAY